VLWSVVPFEAIDQPPGLGRLVSAAGRARRVTPCTMTISLAFLAPSLVKAAVDARLPRGIGIGRLFDAPVAWPRQHQMLGLAR
jgi:hypothetical protein